MSRCKPYFWFTQATERRELIVPEALSRGAASDLPPNCGKLELTVSEENGWPIPLVSNESSAAKIRSLLEEVVARPENLSRKSAEAIKFAETFSWEHMAAYF